MAEKKDFLKCQLGGYLKSFKIFFMYYDNWLYQLFYPMLRISFSYIVYKAGIFIFAEQHPSAYFQLYQIAGSTIKKHAIYISKKLFPVRLCFKAE